MNKLLSKMTIRWHNANTMSDISKSLGDSLEYLRKARGLTQGQRECNIVGDIV